MCYLGIFMWLWLSFLLLLLLTITLLFLSVIWKKKVCFFTKYT